jgi:hypothetical protein
MLIWRYGRALHLLPGSSVGAVAFYDPRLGDGVMSNSPSWSLGQVVDVTNPAEKQIS